MSDTGEELERLLGPVPESGTLSETYMVIPGHQRFELFGCDGALQGRDGDRFRQLLVRIADEVGIDRGLLAVNAIAEHGASIYLAIREVESQEVGLDYWETLRSSVMTSGVSGVTRIRAHPVAGRQFRNEQGNLMPVWAFRNGETALLAFAALLKVYDNRVSAAGTLNRVTRFALVRYAYNRSPRDAVQLAATAAAGTDVLPRTGPAGSSHPLRTATVRAVQGIHLSEEFFT
jgi:hypothetical protein